jgi:hypothetical protein
MPGRPPRPQELGGSLNSQIRADQAQAHQPPGQIRQQMNVIGNRVQAYPCPAGSRRKPPANGTSGPVTTIRPRRRA